MAAKKGTAFFERGSWYHRFKVLNSDGTTRYAKKGGFATRDEAEASCRRCEDEYRQAVRSHYAASARDFEVKDYLVFWLSEIYSARAQNTSQALASYVVYDLLIPNLTQHIRLWYATTEYLDAVLQAAAKTCESAGNKCRELLYMAFQDALKQGYITKNPVSGTKHYRRRKTRITVLSKERTRFFLEQAVQSPWYLEILLALFMGLRKGEIAGLKFSDFDRAHRIVRIDRQVVLNPCIEKGTARVSGYQMTEKPPKSECSIRVLHVPDAIWTELEKRRHLIESNKEVLGCHYNDNGYISCQKDGRPHSPTAFNNALSKICSRSGLPHLTVHGLRHMYATILTEQGVPLVKVSALLGHSSVHTTFEYYCEVSDEQDRIINFLNDEFVPK